MSLSDGYDNDSEMELIVNNDLENDGYNENELDY